MKKLSSLEIRKLWLEFWEEKGHLIIPSASLIPHDDPTLLWINAGIAPLKKYFDGRETPKRNRLANVQKSIRTNDIENVGVTARHHTFFEMLGNFSIGDYFRKEALTWAYEILFSEKWFNLDKKNIYFSYYPEDLETKKMWMKLGVEEERLIPLEGNFWEIGDGPCGPCTEIFYDRGVKYDPENIGLKLIIDDLDNDRYVEIWNIVFSQFNAESGKKREEYKELPSKNIDTGMGLERIVSIIQETDTNFETDLFMPIINDIEKLSGVKYSGQMAFKVIADHIRSVTFAISDGANVSNEGRGYVLRRLIRRAVRYGKKLGLDKPFLAGLVDRVVSIMKEPYPNLVKAKELVKVVVNNEEEKFLKTLDKGEKKLLDYMEQAKGKVITGEIAFLLYDTFGFPIELTLEVGKEHGFEVDLKSFEEELEKQRKRARASRDEDESMISQNEDMLKFKEESIFTGYSELKRVSKVIAIFKDGTSFKESNGEVLLVFDETPFYGLQGGQVGDQGKVVFQDNEYKVKDTILLPNGQHASLVDFGGEYIKVADKVILQVNKALRLNTAKNHSATHLLNYALKEVLGSHVHQQGSSVSSNSLRFDFNNFSLPTDEELLKVEAIVNKMIDLGHHVETKEMALDKAKTLGVEAMFSDKYEDVVRVITIGDSKELCGGTHVSNAKEIGKFVILSCETKGSGIYRIEATTDTNIKDKLLESADNILIEISNLKQKAEELVKSAKEEKLDIVYKAPRDVKYLESYKYLLDLRELSTKYQVLVKDIDKEYQKQYRESKQISPALFKDKVEVINGVKIIIDKLEDVDSEVLKDLVDNLSDNLQLEIVLLANVSSGKIVYVSKNKNKKVKAGDLVKMAAIVTDGNGGGRPDFAQAGGRDVTKVDESLAEVRKYLKEVL
ncbi:MAG: alanine--tRNA ligase [Bacilli bacterium]